MVFVLLAEGCSDCETRCVDLHFKCLLSLGSPFPGYVLLRQLVEGFCYFRESLDEASIEIDKPRESSEFSEVLRGCPSVYSCHLDWVHLYFSTSNDET